MSMSSKKCCVPGCLESGGSHKTLHIFPNPEKDRDRFNKWVMSIGGNIIGLQNDDIFKHRSVCHLHFEEKFCCRNNRLSNIAIPTLNLPGPLSLPTFTYEERRPMRQRQNAIEAPAPSTSSAPHVMPSDTAEKENIGPLSLPTFTYEERRPMRQKQNAIETPAPSTSSAPHVMQRDTAEKENIEYKASAAAVRTAKKRIKCSLEEQHLYNKLLKIRVKLSKCRSIIKKQSISLKAAKKLTKVPALLETMESLPKASKLLLTMQLREKKKKNKGRRFSLNEKILALSIFKQSPKGYRFLRKLIILPAPKTLAKVISQAQIKPGINKNIFKQLKKITLKMTEAEKLCMVIFDEVSLKAGVAYNEKRDKVVGFVTDGQQTKPAFADHAQVFMIRGLIKNYKQAIAYSFSASATSGPEIAKQTKAIIAELQEAGLIVMATICDQGANNRLGIKLLLQETRRKYIQNNEEPKDNIILINNQPIVPLFDPPHLIKCIRNNLLTKNLEYVDENGKKCTAKWEHLMLLQKENPGYKGVRLIPKLTADHVLPEKVAKNKMKVKYATQIFSRTVASNMGYLADKGILTEECKETADILLFFDNLFDSVNGSYSKKKQIFSKPLLGPVTPTLPHHQEWVEAKQKINSMRFINTKTGKAETVPTLQNWVWTLDSALILMKHLENKYKINSVWMRHLNQDPLENFFGAIRSLGCRNTNPTPEKFESAFTTLLINNMSSVHAPAGTNCEDDYSRNLHALIINDCKANPIENCDFEEVGDIIIENMEKKRDPKIMAPLEYISGYFIKNVKTKVFKSCQQCAKDVISTESTEYIKYRNYTNRHWLCSPTVTLVECISAIQDITNGLIKTCFHVNNLKELIKTYILIFVEFNFLSCEQHKEDIIKYLLNITTRFFIYNYCKDLNKILFGRSDEYDNEDKFKILANKYFKKCFKRRRC